MVTILSSPNRDRDNGIRACLLGGPVLAPTTAAPRSSGSTADFAGEGPPIFFRHHFEDSRRGLGDLDGDPRHLDPDPDPDPDPRELPQRGRTIIRSELRELVSFDNQQRREGGFHHHQQQARPTPSESTPRLVFPNFNGKDVHGWLCSAKQLMDSYNISSDLQVRMAALYLDEAPLSWYRGNVRAKGKPLSWAEFGKGLLSMYDNSRTCKVFDTIPKPLPLLVRKLLDTTPQSLSQVPATNIHADKDLVHILEGEIDCALEADKQLPPPKSDVPARSPLKLRIPHPQYAPHQLPPLPGSAVKLLDEMPEKDVDSFTTLKADTRRHPNAYAFAQTGLLNSRLNRIKVAHQVFDQMLESKFKPSATLFRSAPSDSSTATAATVLALTATTSSQAPDPSSGTITTSIAASSIATAMASLTPTSSSLSSSSSVSGPVGKVLDEVTYVLDNTSLADRPNLHFHPLNTGMILQTPAQCLSTLPTIELPDSMEISHPVYKYELGNNVFLSATLVDMYVRCGNIKDAHKVFDKMSRKDRVSWQVMIVGYADYGSPEKSEGVAFLLPTGIIVANELATDANNKVVPASTIQDGWMGLDIGPGSIKIFGESLDTMKSVSWNGPMGAIEFEKFVTGMLMAVTLVQLVVGSFIAMDNPVLVYLPLLPVQRMLYTSKRRLSSPLHMAESSPPSVRSISSTMTPPQADGPCTQGARRSASMYCLESYMPPPEPPPIRLHPLTRNVGMLFCIFHLLVGIMESLSRHPSIWITSLCLALASSVFFYCFKIWRVTEHEKQGHEQEGLIEIFWLMTFFKSASLVGSQGIANMLVKGIHKGFLSSASAAVLAIITSSTPFLKVTCALSIIEGTLLVVDCITKVSVQTIRHQALGEIIWHVLLLTRRVGVSLKLQLEDISWIQFGEPTLVLNLYSNKLGGIHQGILGIGIVFLGLNVLKVSYLVDDPAEAYKALTSLSEINGFDDRVNKTKTIAMIESFST